MATSPWFKGAHLAASPSGALLASIIDGYLRICFTNSPERCIDFTTRLAPKNVHGLRWAPDSSRVLILTANSIEVVNLEDEQNRARVENGSSGLGLLCTADFVTPDQVLTIWEFGRARIWNLSSGQGVDIDNVKSLHDGQSYALRLAAADAPAVLAYISRTAADDILTIHFPAKTAALPAVKLPTVDARSIQWSPDGHWLVVLDSPRQRSNVHVLTADGHLYKTYPMDREDEHVGLGVKSVVWGPSSEALALCRHDGSIDLITGRTLSQSAVIEHSRIIDHSEATVREQTKIWQENVSALSTRTYNSLNMPVRPPLSRSKPSHEPHEIGIAEAVFSCDGKYLASRDASMLSTVWLWDVKEFRPHVVVIQHSNVQRLRWHMNDPDLLMIDCGENIVYLLNAASGEAPQHFVIPATGNATFSFSSSNTEAPTILATTKAGFSMVSTASPDPAKMGSRTSEVALREAMGEEDSIFEILSGRANSDLSHTEMLVLDAVAQDGTAQLDDTFHGKQQKRSMSRDPLDDSDIF